MSDNAEKIFFGKADITLFGNPLTVIIGHDGLGTFLTLYGKAKPFKISKVEESAKGDSKDKGTEKSLANSVMDLLGKSSGIGQQIAKYFHLRNISYAKRFVPIRYEPFDEFFKDERKWYSCWADENGQIGKRELMITTTKANQDFATLKVETPFNNTGEHQMTREEWEKLAGSGIELNLKLKRANETDICHLRLRGHKNGFVHSFAALKDPLKSDVKYLACFQRERCRRFDLEIAPVPVGKQKLEDYPKMHQGFNEWWNKTKTIGTRPIDIHEKPPFYAEEEKEAKEYYIAYILEGVLTEVKNKKEDVRTADEKVLLNEMDAMKREFLKHQNPIGVEGGFQLNSFEFGIIKDIPSELRYAISKAYSSTEDGKIFKDHPFIKLALMTYQGKQEWLFPSLNERIVYGLKEVGLIND